MNKSKLTILTATITAIGIAVYFLIFTGNSNNNVSKTVDAANKKQPVSIQSLKPEVEDWANRKTAFLSGQDFKRCMSVIQSVKSAASNIQEGHIKLSESFINQYPIEQLALAIYAVDLRPTDQLDLKKRLPSVRVDHYRQTQIANDEKIDLTLQNNYMGRFLEASEDERQRMKAKHLITPRDVSTMLRSHDRYKDVYKGRRSKITSIYDTNGKEYKYYYFNNEQIKLAIDHLDKLNSVFQSDIPYSRVTLLEIAVATSNAEMVEYLLNRGVIPENTYTRPNALEVALIQSDFERYPEEVKRIVQLLSKYNLSYRMTDDTMYSQMIGDYGLWVEVDKLKPERIAFFSKLGFDITEVKPIEYFQELADEKITHDLLTFYEQKMYAASDTSKPEVEDCIAYVQQTYQKLSSNDLKDALDHTFNSAEKKLEYLHELEPGLVDAYRHLENNKTVEQVGFVIHWQNSTAADHLIKGEFKQFEALYKKETDNIDFKTVFNRVAHESLEGVTYLLDNGFAPASIELHKAVDYDLDVIDYLVEREVLTIDRDPFNRTLVYYAAQQCNLELIQHLAEKSVPYHLGEYGSDPVGAVLRASAYPGSYCSRNQQDEEKPTKESDIINALVTAYQPPIKDYHLQRLGEVQLLNYDLFLDITNNTDAFKSVSPSPISGYYIEPGQKMNGVPIWR